MKMNLRLLSLTLVVLTVSAQDELDDVAMMIGGIKLCAVGTCPGATKGNRALQQQAPEGREEVCSNFENGLSQLNHVEIFGCPDDIVITMPAFPTEITFSSGLWLEKERKVIVCGGLECFNINAYGVSTANCYTWDPWGSREWEPAETMTHGRTAHILGTINDSRDITRVFAIGGYPDVGNDNYTTEIRYDSGWERLLYLPREFEPHDNAYGCMIQKGDMLYSLRNRVTSVRLSDWQLSVLQTTPPAGIVRGNVGQCALGRKNNADGIMIRDGHWFNLETNVWERVARPPLPSMVSAYTISTFHGKPTIFGVPVCSTHEDEGCSTGTGVVQYDSVGDVWTPIGNMVQDRIWHEIVSMPREVCFATGGAAVTSASAVTMLAMVGFVVAFLQH